MHDRAFTVAEANALIPVLVEVLARIDRHLDSVRQSAERLQVLDLLWGPKLLDPDNPDRAEAERFRLRIATHMADIEELVDREIDGRGLRFPQGGLENGLIDFPTTWRGRWVYLCWRKGEEAIRAWHEIGAGYAGRQDVTPEQVQRMGR